MKWLYNLIYGEKDKEIQRLKDEILSLQVVTFDIPESFGIITWQEEIKLLGEAFKCPINITDNFLQVTSVEEAKKFTVESKIQYRKWTTESYDCDNFSASLYGYWSDSLKSFAIGMARSSNHQFNIMIDKDKKIWIIEPQNNKFMTIEEAQSKSSPDGLKYLPITMIWM
jgi:hypothetical protein